ncbi:alkene reductase [Pseudomonas kitaguniensis]|uniref:alkene reductase n=1 Tax=Pseudomonas kitaguniensis TaxID=2607908 RepID=UPI003D01FC05
MGIAVSQQAIGYLFTPGLYTEDQVEAWESVTQAVHTSGGRIFAQLWHMGRMSHHSLLEQDGAPVSPVARPAIEGCAYAWTTPGVPGQVAASAPRALETEEVIAIVSNFVAAGRRAIQAGFDGVEVHAGNGYLFEQFINGELNTRKDCYGGSIENRMRLLLETIDSVSHAIGARRVGVSISPVGWTNDMHPFDDETQTWLALAAELGRRELAYVHLSDQHIIGADCGSDFFDKFRKAYPGTLIIAGGFDQQSAENALQAGKADLIGYGSSFIANPDLVERMANGWPLAQADRETFYGLHGARGYTDYPSYTKRPESASPKPPLSIKSSPTGNAKSEIRKSGLSLSDLEARSTLTSIRDDFFATWSDGNWQELNPVLAEDALLISSQHGEGTGEAAW